MNETQTAPKITSKRLRTPICRSAELVSRSDDRRNARREIFCVEAGYTLSIDQQPVTSQDDRRFDTFTVTAHAPANATASIAQPSPNAAPTGLTSRNMAARFTSMRSVLGVPEYADILGRQGYREVTNIPSLEKARDVYRMLVDDLRLVARAGG